ncbi:MAG: hypothetical protein ACJ8AK_03175 [Gemmatimonadaceae bacterium]
MRLAIQRLSGRAVDRIGAVSTEAQPLPLAPLADDYGLAELARPRDDRAVAYANAASLWAAVGGPHLLQEFAITLALNRDPTAAPALLY